jgi:hypothetical protein
MSITLGNHAEFLILLWRGSQSIRLPRRRETTIGTGLYRGPLLPAGLPLGRRPGTHGRAPYMHFLPEIITEN